VICQLRMLNKSYIMFLYAAQYIIEENEGALLWLFSFLCICKRNLYLKYMATCRILRAWEYSLEQCCRVIIALYFFSTFLSILVKCGNLIWQNSHFKKMICLSGYYSHTGINALDESQIIDCKCQASKHNT
jgi:hypothetical protein